MVIRLDIMKLTQAAAFLVKRHNGFITRLRLLKLLYIADRELLKELHRPITGDHPVAMDFGPVLTQTYDFLKGEAMGIEVWNRYIERVAPFTHKLVADPGVGKLSKRELMKLDEVIQRYWWMDDIELSELTHDFPEWQRNRPPRGGSRWIPVEDVLEAVGLGRDIERLKAEATADAELDALLAGAGQ